MQKVLHNWQDDHATDTPKQYAAMFAVQGPNGAHCNVRGSPGFALQPKQSTAFYYSILAWQWSVIIPGGIKQTDVTCGVGFSACPTKDP